ncbi:response regulator [Virgibacillus sp. W0181]|uniref:response regulator n=1 Tax=Virgibacillus sp. W0181 TaxID=3391581 RepID=UPI003F48C907
MNNKILVVEDDPDIRDFIKLYLKNDGYHIIEARSGTEGIKQFHKEAPDLVLLDVLLPELDGIEVCREIRKTSITPIIFISNKAEEMDKVIGLTIGADDYVTKPFSPRELVARVRSHLRRKRYYTEVEQAPEEAMHFNNLEIDFYRHKVLIDQNEVKLSSKEFRLLAYMAKHPGRVFTVEELYERVWEESSLGDTRTVMVHISSLRKKIEEDLTNPQYILTVRGTGYRFAEKE